MPVTKKRFEAAYKKWRKAILDPKIQLSSRPQDYTDIGEYRSMVDLGKEILPFVLEKIEQGDFLMNQAAVELAALEIGQMIELEKKKPVKKRVTFMAQRKKPAFLSEQQKSELILKYAREQ